jgi:hypothetical protein
MNTGIQVCEIEFMNYTLPEPVSFSDASTEDSVIVAPGVHISIDPNKGRIQVVTSDRITLNFTPKTLEPTWMELGITLPVQDWLACREIFLCYRAAGSNVSVRPALRLGYADGSFHDIFSDKEHLTTEEVIEFGSEFRLPPRWVDQATWIDFHLFFTPKAGCIDIYTLSLTGVK